jgi:hypothetical protein
MISPNAVMPCLSRSLTYSLLVPVEYETLMYVFLNACELIWYCFKEREESHCRISVLVSLRGRTSTRTLDFSLSRDLVDIC